MCCAHCGGPGQRTEEQGRRGAFEPPEGGEEGSGKGSGHRIV